MKTTFFISIIIMIKHRKIVIKNEKVGFVLQEYGKFLSVMQRQFHQALFSYF